MAIEDSALVVRSITNAMKGQKILENHGISAYVQRSNVPSNREGCGYALKIHGDANKALQILEAAGIKVSSIQGG